MIAENRVTKLMIDAGDRGADRACGGDLGWMRRTTSGKEQRVTDLRYQEITSADELRELYGGVGHRAATKERDTLHDVDRQWLNASRLCVIATADRDGNCDTSPKGDPEGGLVHVIDDHTIAIPDRPGNRRVDGFHNILENPHVGLLFMVAGRPETLRINGRARLVTDAPFFDALTVRNHRPRLAVLVEIDTIYFHCGKALLRSELWKPETWRPEDIESHARMVKRLQDIPESLEELEKYYGDSYRANIYVESQRIALSTD